MDIDKAFVKDIVFAACVFGAVVAICGTTLYGCSEASDKYYKAMEVCANNGGTWIHKETYSAHCVMGKSK